MTTIKQMNIIRFSTNEYNYTSTTGTFAVIGMASFMGGSGRITVMLATVILELTADAGLIAPVGKSIT